MRSILRLLAFIVLFSASSIGDARSQACKAEKIAMLPLTYLNSFMAVTVRIEGKEVMMGVDTGAQTLVTPETAKRFQLVHDDNRRTRSFGTTAVISVSNVLLRNFEFAGKRYENKSVIEIALPVTSILGKPEAAIGGLIGADLLSEYDIDLNFPGKSMTLYKVSGCEKVPLPWSEPYTSIAVTINRHHSILLPVEVNGEKLSGLLDTGANGFAITKQGAGDSGVTAAELKADPKHVAAGAGGVATRPVHKFKTLAIGGETFRDVSMGVLATPLPDGDVLIGQPYLRFRRVWISYSMHMLFLGTPKISASLQSPAAPSLALQGYPPAAGLVFSPPPVLSDKPAGILKSDEAANARSQPPGAPPAAVNRPEPAGKNAAAGKEQRAAAALPKHEGGCPAMPAPLIFEPKSGMVVGHLTSNEAAAMLQRSQANLRREINPKYVMNRRVKVRVTGSVHDWVAVVLPEGMEVALGDFVEYRRAQEDTSAPCRYIPNLAVRVLPPL
jgi:predicted aspartyl protease